MVLLFSRVSQWDPVNAPVHIHLLRRYSDVYVPPLFYMHPFISVFIKKLKEFDNIRRDIITVRR
jgi:hypothetical protein